MIGVFVFIFLIGCCMCCFGLNKASKKNAQQPTREEANQIYFDENDWKYWDSVLPKESPLDGKYAHLIVSRSGKVVGVKPGFRFDGSKLEDGESEDLSYIAYRTSQVPSSRQSVSMIQLSQPGNSRINDSSRLPAIGRKNASRNDLMLNDNTYEPIQAPNT